MKAVKDVPVVKASRVCEGGQDEWDAFAGGESSAAGKPAANDDWMSGFGASSNGAGSASASSDPFGQLAGPPTTAPAPRHQAVGPPAFSSSALGPLKTSTHCAAVKGAEGVDVCITMQIFDAELVRFCACLQSPLAAAGFRPLCPAQRSGTRPSTAARRRPLCRHLLRHKLHSRSQRSRLPSRTASPGFVRRLLLHACAARVVHGWHAGAPCAVMLLTPPLCCPRYAAHQDRSCAGPRLHHCGASSLGILHCLNDIVTCGVWFFRQV